MTKVYLEYKEEELVFSDEDEDIQEDQELDDLFLDEEEQEDKEETVSEKVLTFSAEAIYRNPLYDCKELIVDFDITDCTKLHLVIVKYTQEHKNNRIYGNWHIVKVCKTRREAKDYILLLEDEDKHDENMPWTQDGCDIESIDVVSLDIED